MITDKEEKVVIRLLSLFGKIASVGMLAWSLNAWAVDSPLALIRSTTEQARAVLQDPAYQGTNHHQARIDKVKEVLLPQFDAPEIAKRTLGTYWRERTEEQKKEFTQLFIQLIEKTYSGALDRYNSAVQFFFDQERVEGDFAEVDTRIFDPAQNKTFAVSYRLHKVNGKWLIYDIVAENVSLVRNYRNQFTRILSKSSYEDLVQTIQSKLKELSASPS
ncbi:MAG TPA: ABC transporter substrate-binding protein [Candidatus Binatia bacterium]|nr:ABC transporter substrate-binding protein [Candidatus Binatia bacterium]